MKYKVGMYGGKFMPFHLGHLYCLDVAANECDVVHLIMFINGDQELCIMNKMRDDDDLSVENRFAQCKRAASRYPNVQVHIIDVGKCKLPNGDEDWDAETPLVNAVCGHLDAVYGSELGYADYFKRAYPDAVYRCLDPERKEAHISATMVREMDKNARKEWMV